MRYEHGNELYKSHGVLWRTMTREKGNEHISHTPLCPDANCHSLLDIKEGNYYCTKCDKVYLCKKDYSSIQREVQNAWEGHRTLGYKVYSLDLPPTKVVDEDKEDENYWVQARISEKSGKRMAIVYFGEREKGKQEKSDYSQLFLDFEDEQLRFDKTNKNPMKLLAKLTAEFPDSITTINKTKKVK